jgi:hypothetical protein
MASSFGRRPARRRAAARDQRGKSSSFARSASAVGSGTPRTHHGRGRAPRLPRDSVAIFSQESPVTSEACAPRVARDTTAPTLDPSPEIGANRSRMLRRSRTRVARDRSRARSNCLTSLSDNGHLRARGWRVTSRRRPRLPARPLPLLLVGMRLVEIAAAPGPRKPPVARLSADLPADPLRLACGGLRSKRRAALGTSAARGHRVSVAPPPLLAAFSAVKGITLRPPPRARSPGHVAHDPASKWIRGTRPLKP